LALSFAGGEARRPAPALAPALGPESFPPPLIGLSGGFAFRPRRPVAALRRDAKAALEESLGFSLDKRLQLRYMLLMEKKTAKKQASPPSSSSAEAPPQQTLLGWNCKGNVPDEVLKLFSIKSDRKVKIQKINKYRYIYEDTPIWNREKKQRTHKRNYIGKLDSENRFVMNKTYAARLKAEENKDGGA
jgi:hypothetical protein